MFLKMCSTPNSSIYQKKLIPFSINSPSLQSNNKIFHRCNVCGDTVKAIANPVIPSKWCNCFVHKTEAKLYKFLITEFKHVEKEFTIEGCEIERCLRFDFYIRDYNVIIELDGRQHFEQVPNREPYKEIRKKDIFKMYCATLNNYKIMRISQEDVLDDNYDWRTLLLDEIRYENQIENYRGEKYDKMSEEYDRITENYYGMKEYDKISEDYDKLYG